MDEQTLPATVDLSLVQAAHKLFEGVVEVDLTLVLKDQAHSYADTWCLQITCSYLELRGLNEFLLHLGCDPEVEAHAIAADGPGTADVTVLFWAWAAEIGDLWGHCPDLLERAPYPGMEFELPDHCDFGLL